MTTLRVSKVKAASVLAAAVAFSTTMARADDLQDIGVRIMQSVANTINGSGITVAQVEGSIDDTNPYVFEIGQTPSILAPITYQSALGLTVNAPPNAAGWESSHADQVAQEFVSTNGVAPGVTAIYNYEALFFVNGVVLSGTESMATSIKVINQSFAFSPTTSSYAASNQLYDNFINAHNVVVVSAAGNGPNFGMPGVQFPATAYNGISVAALGLTPGSLGTPEGRSKIDITAPAPGPLTSFAAPYVSGVATMLVQAGSMGLGGSGTGGPTGTAIDARTIKSLLLTGASKPSDWTHTSSDPLDDRYGAGIVNAYGSYRVMTAGKFTPTSSDTTASLGGAHPAISDSTNPGVTVGSGGGNAGWAFQSIYSNISKDAVDHYRISLPSSGLHYMFTATLDWNRPTNTQQVSGINNLDLYLYDIDTNTELAASTSTVDNVEQIYFPFLSPGHYDLQVLKHGGFTGTSNVVTPQETYALSWSAPLFADTNWDGVVNIVDFTNVANHWQQNTQSMFNGDIDGNGIVDIRDFTDVSNNWQSGSLSGPGGLAAPDLSAFGLSDVPEPTSLALLGAGAVMMLRRRARH